MADEHSVSRDVHLPGQDPEAFDLEPSIEPEPAAPGPDRDDSDDPAVPGTAASQPDATDSDPGLGNTLIQPDNS